MKHSFLLTLILLAGLSLKAQNPSPPASFEVFTTIYNTESQLSVADLLAGTSSISNDSADYSLKAVISVIDTANLSTIYLEIGDSIGKSNIYNDSLSFSNLNTSSNYLIGNTIYIETDTLFNLGNIYGKVYLKDSNGNNSSNLSFTSN